MIRYTAGALADIDEAITYLADRNANAANDLADLLRTAINRLDQMPLIGRPGRVEGTREWFVTGTRYIVAYRVVGADVQVLAVRHERRSWPDHFQSD